MIRFYWKMSFGHWRDRPQDHLPPILRRHYFKLRPDDVINGHPSHHLAGLGFPSKTVIEAITESKELNQYLHLRMPFGLNSYVWPSDEPGPVRCRPQEAIDYFHCHL